MVVTPYYFTARMLLEDSSLLVKHYMRVADASPLPIVLYSMPLFAGGVHIAPAVAAALSLHPNIIGITHFV
tara:strand:+ start:601 stop:813 length:213 start_codon:yes stop_codon:yes gene_type:complete